jgi:hypothetical protein
VLEVSRGAAQLISGTHLTTVTEGNTMKRSTRRLIPKKKKRVTKKRTITTSKRNLSGIKRASVVKKHHSEKMKQLIDMGNQLFKECRAVLKDLEKQGITTRKSSRK